jgi:protein-S-isoprenylcysteine O-methyltransferase Ste14
MPSRLRVPFGYLLGIVVVVLAQPTPSSLAAGGAIAAAGEAIRLWASGHIDKTRSLATGGPYAHTRNPLYFGSLVMAIGVAVAAASPWAALAVAIYFAAFYPSAMREEAAFLRSRFPEAYAAWGVPLFFPRLTPAGPRATTFEWSRVRRNREWQTALALPLMAAVLWARGQWLP